MGDSVKKINLKILDTRKKEFFVLFFVIVIFSISISYGLLRKSKEQEFVNRIVNLIKDQNTYDFKEIIFFDDPKKQMIDEFNLTPFLNYLKSDISIEEQFIHYIKNDINNNDQLNNDNIFKDIMWIENKDNNYLIKIMPKYINVSTNYEDVKILVNNNIFKITQRDDFSIKIGPLIPGDFFIKAIYNGEYLNDIKIEKVVNVITEKEDENIEINLEFDFKYINIESPSSDAKIHINGKPTRYYVRNSREIGPVDRLSKIFLEKEFQGELIKSEEFVVGDSNLFNIKIKILANLNKNIGMNFNHIIVENPRLEKILKNLLGVEYERFITSMVESVELNYDKSNNMYWIIGGNNKNLSEKAGIIGLKEDGKVYVAYISKIPYVINYYSNDDIYQDKMPNDSMNKWAESFLEKGVFFTGIASIDYSKEQISALYKKDDKTSIYIKFMKDDMIDFEAKTVTDDGTAIIRAFTELKEDRYAFYKINGYEGGDERILKLMFYHDRLVIWNSNIFGADTFSLNGTFYKQN